MPARTPSIESAILTVRSHRVILAADLADIYQVEPRAPNQAVKRNASRFPADFVFQLSRAEFDSLRSQNAILANGRARPRFADPILKSQIVISRWGGLDAPYEHSYNAL
jgi:hypothetical protein